jgi:putative ABC transport system permease protein
LGGVGGVLLAWMVTRLADVLLTPEFRSLPFRGAESITIDATVIAFAVVAALASAIVFGFAPLVGMIRREPQELLRGGERGSTGAASLARRVLVTTEIALAVVVLGGAGLLVKSLLGVLAVSPGLDAANVLTMQVSLPQDDLYGPPVRADFCVDFSEGAGTVPGITAVGAISHLPLSGANASRALTLEGLTFADHRPSANYRLTCPGFFATLGIPLLAGRDFSDRDTREGTPVLIVNRATVDRYWPGEPLANAVGRRVKLGEADSDGPWMIIVGVVENVRHFGLDANVSREVFRPLQPGDVAGHDARGQDRRRTAHLEAAACRRSPGHRCGSARRAGAVNGDGHRRIGELAQDTDAVARRLCGPGTTARGHRRVWRTRVFRLATDA